MTETMRITAEQGLRLLRDRLLALMPEPGDWPEAAPGLALYRRHADDAEHQPIIYEPVLIIIAQGEKRVRLGPDAFTYGAGGAFLTGVDIPTACAVRGASPDHPFLSLAVGLDRALLAEMAETASGAAGGAVAQPVRRGCMVAAPDANLLDAVLRLVELAGQPEAAKTLAPLFLREIHYRLLTGPFGESLRALNAAGSPGGRIAKAIRLMRGDFEKPLAVPELARFSGMSVAAFHRHFKTVTGMSPVQFQKRLRLERAQRLMLTEALNATEAALAVGYESMQHFSRDYKRLFGDPPRRDIMRMRDGE